VRRAVAELVADGREQAVLEWTISSPVLKIRKQPVP
jgi:hypothetical protein